MLNRNRELLRFLYWKDQISIFSIMELNLMLSLEYLNLEYKLIYHIVILIHILMSNFGLLVIRKSKIYIYYSILILRNLKIEVYHCTSEDEDAENILIGSGYAKINPSELTSSDKIFKVVINSAMFTKSKATLNIKVGLK